MRLVERHLDNPLPALLRAPPGNDVRLHWLGQAGFVLDGAGNRVVIDPYLSDSLAQKYRATRFPHIRMMSAPVQPSEIRHVTAVLATHAHSDHLDPGTLPALLTANPNAALVVPASCAELALRRARVGPERLKVIDAGETLDLVAGLAITATRAAHEALEVDERGKHRFLGYLIRCGRTKIFHSGDTIPFDGQVAEVRALRADIALLPVNGRDAKRRANGVPGNMTLAEAVSLARQAGIGAVVAHHFGMFGFNTVPRADIEAMAAAVNDLQLAPARADVTYHVCEDAAPWP